ncbi:methyltransferase [Flavobacteriaceae bacterium S356]|uniref:Methyltransferase n=1 Tax=Asprobacillus argus TaxID=3076534 RepID=A0ABU3LBK0_9FLAO|nr:methyltransferase [Flavobacteriaceae bacterium S356]
MKKMDDTTRQNLGMVSKMIYGNWMQQCTYAFAELAMADVLKEAPKTHADLSRELRLNGAYLKQFLRCVDELGYVSFNKQTKTYALTDVGAILGSDHPYSKRAEARLNGAEYRYMPWGHLVSILKNGNGKEYSPTVENGTLDFLQDKPQLLEVFHEAMFKIWKTEDAKIVEAFDFKPFKKVMDIGGGKGSFLLSMLEQNNHLEGVVFDLATTFDEGNLSEENQLAGDFFNEVPDVADLYTMKNVIHNWPENKTKQIVNNVRKAMLSTNGIDTPIGDKRMLIIENILPDDGTGDISNWMSLNFMILVDGQERNREEYKELGEECGFHLEKIYATDTNRQIIEYSLL